MSPAPVTLTSGQQQEDILDHQIAIFLTTLGTCVFIAGLALFTHLMGRIKK